jgi:hypothetical protein
MKRCADCRQWKPNEQFPRNRNSKDGRHCYCRECNNARSRESRQRLHGGARHYHLMHRYGIGADEVDALIDLQGNRCPICGRPDPNHVDHDHKTGRVRGVLCFNCNGGLGQFADDIDRLAAAVAYLDAGRVESDLLQLARVRTLALVGGGAVETAH